MWAFTLPRNSRQFFVYLLDPSRRHGDILKASYVGFGETILAADLIVDLAGADGVTVGRILAVPYPDQVSADGPAREPLVVYAGPLKDPTAIVSLSLPPREALQLPSKAASMKADVLVSHYEVSGSVPQGVVLAYGVGRPTKDVTLVSRELTTKEPDQILKIDLSSLPEERFPAVVWLYQRRTFAWKTTGGYLPPVAPSPVPPRGELKLSKVKRNEAIPHVIPLLFTGPRPSAESGSFRGVDPAAQVAGGMANGLIRDALAREAGGTGGLTQSLGGAPATDAAGGVSNVTYVMISSPPHTPGVDSAAVMPTGVHYQSAGTGPALFAPGAPGNGPGGYAYRPAGTLDSSSGTFYDRGGNVTYDPRSGATSGENATPGGELYYNVGGVVAPIRRTRR